MNRHIIAPGPIIDTPPPALRTQQSMSVMPGDRTGGGSCAVHGPRQDASQMQRDALAPACACARAFHLTLSGFFAPATASPPAVRSMPPGSDSARAFFPLPPLAGDTSISTSPSPSAAPSASSSSPSPKVIFFPFQVAPATFLGLSFCPRPWRFCARGNGTAGKRTKCLESQGLQGLLADKNRQTSEQCGVAAAAAAAASVAAAAVVVIMTVERRSSRLHLLLVRLRVHSFLLQLVEAALALLLPAVQ